MNNTTAVWVKASDRLPEDLDTKFCRYPVDKEFYKFTAFCKEWENANGKKGWFNSDFEHYSEKVYLPNLFEWLDESPSPTEPGRTAEEILSQYPTNREYPSYYHESHVIAAMHAYRSMPLEDKGKEGWIK